MGTHPIFESDFDCLTDLCVVSVEVGKWGILKRSPPIWRSSAPPRRNRAKSLPARQNLTTFQNHSTPFSLQRLCELVLMPDKYYKDTNKYIHALLKCLLVVSGWRKQVQPDLPKQNEAPRIEPDSTTNEQSQEQQKVATTAAEVKLEQAPTQQPDSTTNEEIEEKQSDTKKEDDVKDEPVFLERPKQEKEDEDDEGGIFSRQKSPIKTSPVKRKVQILPSNIKLNVGNGKAEPNTEDSEEKAAVNSETETDEDKRKRKRSVDNEETDELSSAAS